MLVKIKRKKLNEKPFIEEFNYDGTGMQTVSSILDAINRSLESSGKDSVVWDCSCVEAKCGACAMVINDKPGLACDTFIDCDKNSVLTLEALKKFPVIEDLSVDRSVIFDNQKVAEIYLGDFHENSEESRYRYNAAKCLKCGLCLEICPGYKDGKTHFGAVMLHDAYLQASASKDREKELAKAYKEHFFKGCLSCLKCTEICPNGISTLASASYMKHIL